MSWMERGQLDGMLGDNTCNVSGNQLLSFLNEV